MLVVNTARDVSACSREIAFVGQLEAGGNHFATHLIHFHG
jgi:hypothetical protein